MAKVSKLTVSKVKQEYAKLNKMKTVAIHLDNGDVYNLDIRENITNTNIDKAFEESMGYLQWLVDTDQLAGSNITSTMYLCLSLIEQITSLELPKTIEDRIAVLSQFYDLGLLRKILDKFDEEEMNKATGKLEEMLIAFTKKIDEAKETIVKAEEEYAQREQVLWEADERIAQINELSYDDTDLIVDESEETKSNVIPMKKEDEADGAE